MPLSHDSNFTAHHRRIQLTGFEVVFAFLLGVGLYHLIRGNIGFVIPYCSVLAIGGFLGHDVFHVLDDGYESIWFWVLAVILPSVVAIFGKG